MRMLDGHHRKEMNFLLLFVDAVESRERAADMKPIDILPVVDMQALLVAPAARIRVFLESFQPLHHYPPAL